MDSYCELKALPNPEIIQAAVVAELMQVLHQSLLSFDGRIGLDFPAYRQQGTLGGIIRALGGRQDIKALQNQLANHPVIQDYGLLSERMEIPSGVTDYACYQRRHARGNSRFTRLKKRHLERGTWTEELEQAISAKLQAPLDLPYVALKSASTAQKFLLFIQRKKQKEHQPGTFNSYGLSLDGANVPRF